jgi:hypothetical protein
MDHDTALKLMVELEMARRMDTWRHVFLAVALAWTIFQGLTGLLMGCWGWRNVHNDRRLLPLGTLECVVGMIFWGHAISQYLEYSGWGK